MNVPTWVWLVTLVGLSAILLADLLIVGHRPHEPSTRESLLWVSFYMTLAVLFGIGVFITSGAKHGSDFFQAWLVEYSLSVDNLFVFVIIMARFAVPRIQQQRVLFIGIVLALLLRAVFIAAGVTIINLFAWVFYIFGAFLLYTAVTLALHGEDDEEDFKENVLIRWSRRVLPLAKEYDGAKLTARVDGKRLFTPMLIVLIAIGTTDLMFALDSIPAVFGFTTEAYLVFTVNVFALMGLRQLYFLLGGLLNRLVYLSVGLSVVLGFIGVKLVLEALRKNNVPFINGGQEMEWIPKVPVQLSLPFIVVTLAVTTVASLLRSRRRQGTATEGRGTAEEAPVDETPSKGTSADGTPANGTGANSTAVEGAPAKGTRVKGGPARGTPVKGTPAKAGNHG